MLISFCLLVPRFPLRLPLLAVLAALSVACAGPRPGEEVLVWLIGAGPEAVQRLDPRTDFALRPAWRPRIGEDLASWSFYVPSAAAALAGGGGGIDLGPLRESRYLVWTGSLGTSSTGALRFRFQEPLAGLVELYWNGAGEDFAPQRYLLQSPDPHDPREVSFALGAARFWQGTVTRIGLRLLTPPLAGQALLEVEGLAYAAPEGMGRGETRYVTLNGHGMNAWLARPGSTVRRQIEVPRRARLRFQVAPWLPGDASVRVRVVARGRHGRRVLVEHELRQRADLPRLKWASLEADLGDFAGETVDLAFEAGPAPPGSLVMWGEPHLTGAARERWPRRPNVVLISLDTVRADHLSLYGYRRQTTPWLDAWARRRATVFETAVASAPWTLPSHVSMLTGIDAVHHGVNRRGPIPSSLVLLPQRFRDAGYATYGTTGGVLLTPELGFAQGFDELKVRGRMESLPEWDAELANGVTDALRWLMSHRGERFFLFFHTYEAHSPYQPREPYFSEFGGSRQALNAGEPVWMEEGGYEDIVRPRYLLFHPSTYAGGVELPKKVLQAADRELAATLYDSGLAYIDRQLSRLLEYLESEGLMEDTVVVVTSDHGESLYEHGLVGHGSLYDHDLLVPLVIAAPDGPAEGHHRVSAQVRSVDIAPTLAELAGLEPLGNTDGSSLGPFLRGEPSPPRDAWSYALSTVRGVSLRDARRQLKRIAQDTIFEPFRGTSEVYDLRRDPGESRNLSGGGDWQRRLKREVRAAGPALQIRVRNAGPVELSGLLSGDNVDAMITSPDLGYSCCQATPRGVRFQAPPGEGFTLSLQDRSGALKLRLDSAGQSWEGSFLLAGARRQLVLWDGKGWRRADRVPGGGWTGVEVLRQGSAPAQPQNEEEMRARLRALGYVR